MSANMVGTQGEVYARTYLEKIGYEIIEHNVRYHRNEIDIIARDGDYIVYIEVKTRSSSLYTRPAEAVTLAKQRAISAAALGIAYQRGWMDKYQRFDVVEILVNDENYFVNLIQNAFDFIEPAAV